MLHVPDNPAVSTTRRIVDAVHQAVAAGTLAPGDKLPTRAALAKQLGIHKAAVRHAYERLEAQGLVVSRQGSGTYIREQTVGPPPAAPAQRFDPIVTVVGAPSLAECERDIVRITTDILAGVSDRLGAMAGRFEFAESVSHECLGHLTEGSAVLVKDAQDPCDPAVLADLKRRGIPVVGVWRDPCEKDLPAVHYDPYQAMTVACQHLIDCGYRSIGFIGDMGKSVPLGMKFYGFTHTLYRAGFDFKVQHVGEVDHEPGRAYGVMAELVRRGDLPDAFFVDTDMKAIEAIYALHDAGLRVPEDVGIVGYDDIPEAAVHDPPLTTVRLPRREIGRRAAQMLIDMREEHAPPVHVNLDSSLIVRGTTLATGSPVPTR